MTCARVCGLLVVLVAALVALRPAPATAARMGSGPMFDGIASYYDAANRVMSLGLDASWRNALVEQLRLAPGDRVLDLGTGTADVALTLAAAQAVTVVGLDPSTGMLAQGRDKVSSRNMTDRVSLEVGDAQSLGFADASFDKVSMAFAIRNVPDRGKALREIARVAKPAARVALLEFSLPPADSFIGIAARGFVQTVVPFLGGLISTHPAEYAYLAESIADFPSPPEFRALIEASGLRVLEVTHLAVGAVQIYTATPA